MPVNASADAAPGDPARALGAGADQRADDRRHARLPAGVPRCARGVPGTRGDRAHGSCPQPPAAAGPARGRRAGGRSSRRYRLRPARCPRAVVARRRGHRSDRERGRTRFADDWLGSCFEVVELHVLPTHQGPASAATCFACCWPIASERTAALSALEPDGSRARRLYTAEGFVPLLSDFRFPGGPTRYAVLAKRLDSPDGQRWLTRSTSSSSAPGTTASSPRATWRKAGLRVEVLERDDVIGGAVSTVERFPGYRVDRGSSLHVMIRWTAITEELDLAAPRPALPGLRPLGIPADPRRTRRWHHVSRRPRPHLRARSKRSAEARKPRRTGVSYATGRSAPRR